MEDLVAGHSKLKFNTEKRGNSGHAYYLFLYSTITDSTNNEQNKPSTNVIFLELNSYFQSTFRRMLSKLVRQKKIIIQFSSAKKYAAGFSIFEKMQEILRRSLVYGMCTSKDYSFLVDIFLSKFRLKITKKRTTFKARHSLKKEKKGERNIARTCSSFFLSFFLN